MRNICWLLGVVLSFHSIIHGQYWQIILSSGSGKPTYSVDQLEILTWDMAGRKNLVVQIKGDVTLIPVDSIDVIQLIPYQGFHLLGGITGFFLGTNTASHQLQYILETTGPNASPSPFMLRVGLSVLVHTYIGVGVGSLLNIANRYRASERYDISGETLEVKVQVIQEIIASEKHRWRTRLRRSYPISTSPSW